MLNMSNNLRFISFPGLNSKMTNAICRFLATPSPVFELKVEQEQVTTTMQKFAIVRLAQCIQVNMKNEYDLCHIFKKKPQV